ncbi:O-antigen ligase family protein [Erysipelothrix sp. HDW6C]|uniref:O-antigen ligase family protein n=1 Tax=Erysipelothrix sp. HDW6C TaxID=2714930 RepID=UPI0014086B65|nr:O-antigen ligase family protein [Erysipelothrix sp. HDW6C]QIK69683.1 O-antigen ligase family protein [Erysipelothrix sp. HDW6C]
MMNPLRIHMQRVISTLKEYQLFLLIFMLFLPNYLMYPALIVGGVFIFYELIKYRDVKWSFIWLLVVYVLIVAWLNNNVLGIVAGLFLLYLIAYVAAIKRRMTPRNYMKLQYYIVWSSLFNFFFIFIRFRPQWFEDILAAIMKFLNIGHLPAWQLPYYGQGYFRAYSTFDNPNFYAFILLIVLLVCFNQLQFQLTFKNYKLFSFYAGAFIINTYALLLTGTRSILFALAIGLVVIILVQRKWLQLKILILLGALAGIFILTNPSVFPRFMQVAEHSSIRFNIWENALHQINKEPLWGKGLLTYAFLFDNTHAHNIYIESFLSLGVVGTMLLVAFVMERFYDIYKNAYYLDYPLALSLMAAFFLYGIFDVPIYYFQTSLLFVAVFCIPNRNNSTS